MANKSNLGQSMMKTSLELPAWKCPERETAPKWHWTTAEETSAFTEQYQYPTCLSWQSLPDQFKINTNLLKRFMSRTINIKHIPSVQMLILQPQSWWVLGGAQPSWLQRQALLLAAPLLTTQPEEKMARKNNSRVVEKGPKRLMATAGQVSLRPSSAVSTERLGAAQPGNVCDCCRATD